MIRFNEWMAFRQTVPEGNDGGYRFVGTYNTENIGGIGEGRPVEVAEALKCVPESFRMQFSGLNGLSAGKSVSEQSKEVLWITNKDMDITYVFERA